jgi:threonine/homoserine/homoserine lactone efflux protein
MEIVIPGAANLALFVSAALVLLVVPGPAVLYIFARSVEQGRLAGFVSILGIHAATLVHVVDIAVQGNGSWRLLRDGFIVNLLNPKTALFFLAFLPQFVEVDRGQMAIQIAFLGLLFTSLGIVTDGCYALAAGTLGNWAKRNRAYLQAERYVSGVVFIALGLTAAFAGNQKK